MAEVWTAKNLDTGAEVALKMLLSSFAESAEVVARFRREAHATAQLSHRGIVRVFDLVNVPDADGSLAMVMERLWGTTLAQHLENQGTLSVEETASIVLPLLGALEHVHGMGMVHRDLKPENIFLAVEPDGELVPKLLDFGISKSLRARAWPITFDGLVVGTPSHMSPEQLRGEAVDARSDIFSMGIVLCMCLTGRNPFVTPEVAIGAMLAAMDATPERPAHVPPSIWRVVSRAMAKRPDDRFASARELAEALALATRATTARAQASPVRRKGRAKVALLACVVGLSFASIGWARHGDDVAPHADERVTRSASPRRHLHSTDDRLIAGEESLARRRPIVPRVEPEAPRLSGRRPHAHECTPLFRDPGF